jgi:hypothetical protein
MNHKHITENPSFYLEKYRKDLSESQILQLEAMVESCAKKHESKDVKSKDADQYEQVIDEVTSTASVGGSFEVPFKVQKKFEEGKGVELTSEQMAKLTIDLLLEEYVYSNPEKNYKEIDRQNKKNSKEPRNKIEDIAKENSKLETELKDDRNELEDNTKENIETKDADAIKKRHKDNFASEDEIERRNIERQKGGIQMMEYDHISDASKEFQEKEFKKGDKAISNDNGSAATDTELGKELLDNVQKIKKGKQVTPTDSLGDDFEINPNKKIRKRKSLGEGKNIYKVDTVIGNNKRALFEIAKNIKDDKFIIEDASNDAFHMHKENGRNTLTYVLNETKIDKANSRINSLFGYVSPNTKNSFSTNEKNKFIKSFRNGSKN